MRELQSAEILEVSGASLDMGQAGYVFLMATQALSNLAVQGAFKLMDRTPAGFAINYILIPTCQIMATVIGDEVFNKWIAPKYQDKAA